jgi:hypothetical protein
VRTPRRRGQRLAGSVALAAFACAVLIFTQVSGAAGSAPTVRPATVRVSSAQLARSFSSATQSHPGACALDTDSVATGAGDWQRNGVLAASLAQAHVPGSGVAAARRWLTVGRITQSTTTANHGCTGTGAVFPWGPRTLHRGETVVVKVPAALRGHVCSGPGGGCAAVTVTETVVFPTNCWNLNVGHAKVTIYVHPQVPRPAARSLLTCRDKGVVVTLSNAAGASAGAVFEVNHKRYGPLRPGTRQRVTVPARRGRRVHVQVSAGDRVLIDRAFTDTCPAGTSPPVVTTPQPVTTTTATTPVTTPVTTTTTAPPTSTSTTTTATTPPTPTPTPTPTPPTPPPAPTPPAPTPPAPTPPTPTPPTPPTPTADPAASASFSCTDGSASYGGTVGVVLSNDATATADATFVVNGTSYGPVAPGASQTVTIPVALGDTTMVTVTSGGTTLLPAQPFTNTCVDPSASSSLVCAAPGAGGGGTATLTLTNGAGALEDVTFTVAAKDGPTTLNPSPPATPVAPGASENVTFTVPEDTLGLTLTVTAMAGGTTYSSQTYLKACPAGTT